jgi:GNAT superfamily N-acetyltransferase
MHHFSRKPMSQREVYNFHPLTPEHWKDFEELFGKRGACGGCWCMWWRLKRSDFNQQKGEGNRRAMKKLVHSNKIPGILAYHQGKAVGWCSVAPREEFTALGKSRILQPLDSLPVWSIVCFFISKEYRKVGLSGQLINAALQFVKQQGGEILEGYPVEPKKNIIPPVFAWTGFASSFRKAGFKEVARRSETRPIMRFYIASERNSK